MAPGRTPASSLSASTAPGTAVGAAAAAAAPPRRVIPAGCSPLGDDAEWHVIGLPRRAASSSSAPRGLRLLYIPAPPAPEYRPAYFSNAAVVSAAGGHDELRLRPHLFRVVFVSSNAATKRSTAFVYNSATFRWTKAAATEMSSVIDGRPSVLIGQTLYWHLISHGLVAFNLETHELHEILVPADAFDDVHDANLSIVVPRSGGGGVGLAAVSGYILQLWTLRDYTHGASTWDLRNIVVLDALLPLRNARLPPPPQLPASAKPMPLVWLMALDEDENVGWKCSHDYVILLLPGKSGNGGKVMT
ncbi:hypothetical protein OsJ_30675 [Oryza sativa Japonica Group]|uniref:Uncharacterized protein n=1 Tax=Oryza sativa subsp. japonica TaxID=39947 RepID=A3C2E3_ORYSJ|nr:hypothetical protein OsJ_30675 [Oryza sativa Japonica Group]